MWIGSAHSIEMKVRFRDVDGMGHMNNAVYFTFLEMARTEYYMKRARKKTLAEVEFILVHISCDFKSEASWGETLVVELWPTKLGNSSWYLGYRMYEKETGRVVAEAESVQAAYDYEKKTTIPIPEDFRRSLEEDLAKAQI